jgi:hypothetical protein
MALQVRSSARGAERLSTAVIRALIFASALSLPLPWELVASTHPQTRAVSGKTDRFRFEVSDSETDRLLPNAAVSLTYWQRTESGERKQEIEIKTDKNGIAEFPRVNAEKLAVSVTVSGYRPCWLWIRPQQAEQPIRIVLDKWISKSK